MAAGASIIHVYMAFEREERLREKKQDALELEWLEWDKVQEVLAAEKEVKEQEAQRKDPQGKEAERTRRSAQVWESAWVVGAQRKKAKRKEESYEL
jgi:hypothetical protein